MFNLDVFGPPRSLRDDQVASLKKTQEAYLALANLLIEVVPNTDQRTKALQALSDAKTFSDEAVHVGRSIVTQDVVADLYSAVEKRNERVIRAWFNILEFADIRKYGQDHFDVEHNLERLKQGIQGLLWGAEVRVSKKIPVGMAYIVGDAEGEADLARDWVPDPSRLVRI